MTPITVDEYNKLKSMWRRLTEKHIKGTATKAESMFAYELRLKLLQYEERN